jgi:HAD superfamily hydrolase (TIGR01549 family)
MKDRYSTVLFDLDGTLIDSVILFREACQQMIQRVGANFNTLFFWEWHGKRLTWLELLAHHGIFDLEEDYINEEVHKIFFDLVSRDSSPLPGVEELLEFLSDAGYKLGIVTNASRAYVDLVNKNFPLSKWFSVIITSDDTLKCPKPDPKGLLLACKNLGVTSKDAIYIGDQEFDLIAAKNAGMDSCLLFKADTFEVSSTPTIVVNSLPELKNFFRGCSAVVS